MLAIFRDPAFWLYFAAWVPYLAYVLVYGLGSPWYESQIGTGLFFTKLAILAVLTNVLIIIVFGDYGAKDTVRGVLLGAVVLGAWYQLFVLFRTKRINRNSHTPRRRSSDHV